MAARILACGADPYAWRSQNGSYTNDGNLFNGAWAGNGCQFSGGDDYLDFTDANGDPDSAVMGETIWLHTFWNSRGNLVNGRVYHTLRDGSDDPWIAIVGNASGQASLCYNSGSGVAPVWTELLELGRNFNGTSIDNNYDVAITLGDPHSFQACVGQALVGTGTFEQASLTELTALFVETYNSAETLAGTLVTVDRGTVGAYTRITGPTGAGANSGQAGGTYADIDDTSHNDSDFVFMDAAAQKATFAWSDLAAPAEGVEIYEHFLHIRARNNGSDPNNLAPVRRDSASGDNVGANLPGLAVGFDNFTVRYSGSAVDRTEFNASEFGFQAAT